MKDAGSHKSGEPKKYEYIDVMRGIAILLVIVTHTSANIRPQESLPALLAKFGQFGVELFFVASALTLTLSMRARGSGKRETVWFWIRRFFRIAPLYYTGILFYVSLGFAKRMFYHDAIYTRAFTIPNVAANFLFLHGLFPPGNNNIVPGGWSIGTEMLFYAIFPILFLRINTQRKAFWFVVLSLAANIVFQEIFCLKQGASVYLANDSFRYFLILNQLPAFGCGICLAFAVRQPAPESSFALDWIACLLVFAFACCVWQVELFGGISFAIVPTLAGLSFFYLGRRLSHARSHGILLKGVASIGRESYSIYIFHFVFAWDLAGVAYRLQAARGAVNPYIWLPVMVCLTTAATYGVAILTKHVIEDNGIEFGRKVIAADERLQLLGSVAS